MKVFVCICLVLVSSVYGSDYACTSQGGSCLNWKYYKCTAGYEQGLCDGDSDIRCCMPCDSRCQSQESGYEDSDDSACTDAGGVCQDNTNYCAYNYYGGMCGGSASRQCCSQSSSSGTSGSTSLGKCHDPTEYGDVMDIQTDGCKQVTADQDNIPYDGVPASNQLAEDDSADMRKYKSEIEDVSASTCIQGSVIAGIISRESRAGAALDANGYGDNGNAYGLMQIDTRYHTVVGGPYSEEHINQGTGILIDMINDVKAEHPTWSDDETLKGGICAYNSGPGNVQTYNNMDEGTTGNDYSDDVVARAQWYNINEGY